MIDARELSSLVGNIYDAVLKPNSWQDVLARFCSQLEAKAASIHVIDPVEGKATLFVEYGTDPAWTALLMAKYAGMSPIGAAVLLAEIDEPVSAFDLISEEEMVESRFYKEWSEPQGYHDMLGAIIAKKPHQIGAVSATRTRDKGRFGAADKEIVGLIAPHVRRAVMLSGLLEQQVQERSAIASVLDRLSTAVMIVDRSARVLKANAAASKWIDNTATVRASGDFILTDEVANAQLKAALARDGLDPSFIVARDTDGPSSLFVVMPLDLKAGTFAIFLNQPERDAPAIAKPLAALFGLTPREVSVLMPLLQGGSIEAIADGLGIALPTARSHLNNLFAKTGTNRQIDLVQKVSALVPPVRLSP